MTPADVILIFVIVMAFVGWLYFYLQDKKEIHLENM